jgi:hypothetical protein
MPESEEDNMKILVLIVSLLSSFTLTAKSSNKGLCGSEYVGCEALVGEVSSPDETTIEPQYVFESATAKEDNITNLAGRIKYKKGELSVGMPIGNTCVRLSETGKKLNRVFAEACASDMSSKGKIKLQVDYKGSCFMISCACFKEEPTIQAMKDRFSN